MRFQDVGVVKIGSPRGLIAVYFDESAAWDYFHSLRGSDMFREEIAEAIERAYPKPAEGDNSDG